MRLSEERIKEIVSIKERLTAKIEAHEREIRMLEKNLGILDEILRESSFTRASSMLGPDSGSGGGGAEGQGGATGGGVRGGAEFKEQGRPAPQAAAQSTPQDVRPILRKGGSGGVIANAHVAKDQISIDMADGTTALSEGIPPFRSFFVEKILEGMRKRDQEDAQNGRIPEGAVLSYEVETDGESNIRRIIIRNYRDERRATELVNTAGWSLTRMLEKIGG